MKRIIFPKGSLFVIILILGLLVLGGCRATEQMDEVALETSLETVNQALGEGKVLNCFVGIDVQGRGMRDLVAGGEGCPVFEKEEDLQSFCMGEMVEAAKCDDYIKLIDSEGNEIYYDIDGVGVTVSEEMECEVSIECGVEVEGVEIEKEEAGEEGGEVEEEESKEVGSEEEGSEGE